LLFYSTYITIYLAVLSYLQFMQLFPFSESNGTTTTHYNFDRKLRLI
jgi:hypothetical protein